MTGAGHPQPSGPSTFGYTTPGLRMFLPVFFGILLVGGVYFAQFVLFSSDEEFIERGGGESSRLPATVFVAVWLSIVGVTAIRMLWTTGTKVVVSGNELSWSSALRSRTVPLSTVVGNDASSRRHDSLVLADGTKLSVLATDDGWLAFLSFLADRAPRARFVMARSTRFNNGFAGRNSDGFRAA